MSEYQAILQQPTDGRMPVIGCHLSSAKGYAAMAKMAASMPTRLRSSRETRVVGRRKQSTMLM